MDLAAIFVIEFAYAIASLVLISAGLAVVFGMMRVINLAHGEFMMLGGYATILSVNSGINIYVAMLVIAPLTVGVIGLLVERLVIRHLYGRLIDTMLATGSSEEFNAAVRALDRVLTAGRYVIPIWQYDVSRIAHIRQMKYPADRLPIYGDGVNFMPDVWWYEE